MLFLCCQRPQQTLAFVFAAQALNKLASNGREDNSVGLLVQIHLDSCSLLDPKYKMDLNTLSGIYTMDQDNYCAMTAAGFMLSWRR